MYDTVSQKGPWKAAVEINSLVDGKDHVVVKSDHNIVALCGRVGAHDEAESWENARLIAEAPSLQDKCNRLELENMELRKIIESKADSKMTVEKFYESILYRIVAKGIIAHWATPIIEYEETSTYLPIRLTSTGEYRTITQSALEEAFSIKIRKPDYNIGKAKIQRDVSLLTDKEIDEIAQIAVFGQVISERKV